jgi:hypothetical protein
MKPGVLFLKQSFGRREKKLLYKCVPNDKNASPVFIPYELKPSFSKVIQNLFIIYNELLEQIVQIIGPVDIVNHFYEYQLYCKNLFVSNTKINKIFLKIDFDIISQLREKYSDFEDRRDECVFSIDPEGCLDYDDAFSVLYDETGEIKTVNIYISNVPAVLDHLNIWHKLTDRVSTLYMPDKKHQMLPSCLSEGACSLKQGTDRAVFSLSLNIQTKSFSFSNCFVNIKRNFIYESGELLQNKDYQSLKEISGESDSHKVVEYFMTKMNFISSQKLLEIGSGIFRRGAKGFGDVVVGEYSGIAPAHLLEHCGLQLSSYVHITSPIRRLVDLLNMIKINEPVMSGDAMRFYNEWLEKIEYINKMSAAGRKIQNDCSLLHLCLTDKSVLEKTYSAIVIDKYLVYISELKFTNKIKREDLVIGETITVKLFIFEKENSFKKKIRLN